MNSLKAAAIGAAVACFVCLTTVALAGSGIGGVFNLGQTNSVNAKSTLTGNTAGPQVSLGNSSIDPAATALSLSVPAGRPPLKVGSSTKVANLNADKLDGLDSTSFLPKTGTAADSSKLGGKPATSYLPYASLNSLQGSACENVASVAGTFLLKFGSSIDQSGWNAPAFYCLTADGYEPNDTSGTYFPIPNGTQPLKATIYPAGDQDWWKNICLNVGGCALTVTTPVSEDFPISCDGTIDGTPFNNNCFVTPNNGQVTLMHVTAAAGSSIVPYTISIQP